MSQLVFVMNDASNLTIVSWKYKNVPQMETPSWKSIAMAGFTGFNVSVYQCTGCMTKKTSQQRLVHMQDSNSSATQWNSTY
jgi:hypothetical protein